MHVARFVPYAFVSCTSCCMNVSLHFNGIILHESCTWCDQSEIFASSGYCETTTGHDEHWSLAFRMKPLVFFFNLWKNVQQKGETLCNKL